MSQVTLGDFCPWNTWTFRANGGLWAEEGEHEGGKSVLFSREEHAEWTDRTTGRTYKDESRAWVWVKCGGMALATPIVHGLLTLGDMVFRIVKLVTLSHFWLPATNIPAEREEEDYFVEIEIREYEFEIKEVDPSSYHFKARLEWAGQDLEKLVMRPLILLGLELSAIYGLVNPYDGRKLCASFERLSMELDPFKISLAPSFQPNEEHSFL